MKYSMSNRQSKNILSNADEIIVRGNDYKALIDYIVEYPDKTIIIDVPNYKFEEMQNTILQCKSDNLVCKIYNLQNRYWFKENEIKYNF